MRRTAQTALAKVSRKEVTRIAFERGRVRKVTGSAGEFVLEKDDEKGQIFMRPTDPQSTKPINLFLTSERGTVALLLQPVDTPSDSIVIREPASAARRPPASRPAAVMSARSRTCCSRWPRTPCPTTWRSRSPARDIALWPGTRSRCSASAAGQRRGGREVPADQHRQHDLGAGGAELFKPGVMAVSVEQPSLRPGEATNLFVIRERKSDD
jgi:conjugal transfer pilus assembly protein TraK